MKKLFIYTSICLAVLTAFTACNKKMNYGSDPYGGQVEPLGIKFADKLPSPSQARPGEAVTYRVEGASKFPNMEFFVNNVKVTVSTVTDSTVTVQLPSVISTGSAKIVVDGQTFAGPLTPILGKVSIDPTFNPGTGANGMINKIIRLKNNQIFIGGNFTDYNGNKSLADINGLARINSTGEFVTGMSFGKGAQEGSAAGYVSGIEELSDGKLLIYGTFNSYDSNANVKNITVLNSTGSLYKESVSILNLTEDPENSTMLVPAFNGGANKSINKVFVRNSKVTAIGNFTQFTNNYYERSTYNSILRDYFEFNNIFRMNMNGSLDSTFLVNHNSFPKRGGFGVNGYVNDGYMDANGKIILACAFTRFNNAVNANNILRLNADGSFDNSFNIGAGPDKDIAKVIPYTNGRYFLIGKFDRYNGQEANRMVLINADGTVDPSFKALKFTNGSPNYLAVLENGKILVSGTFTNYNQVIREGLMILNPDGTLAANYNNTGRLVGNVYDSYQGTNSLGQKTITLVGYISSFNGKLNLGNIVRLIIQD